MANLINKIANSLGYGLLIIWYSLSRNSMPRKHETFKVTEMADNVREYGMVMNSVMTAPYAIALDYVYRLTSNVNGHPRAALDLCTGPGHFANCLSKYLGFEKVTGVDLSTPMVELANSKAEKNVDFQIGNVEKLIHQQSNSYDVVSFLNGAHHMDSIDNVENILAEAERVAKATGVIFVMDPVRLKSPAMTEAYIKVAGANYRHLGLNRFCEDFRESMYASFTPGEFVNAIPKSTRRTWVNVVPSGAPTFHLLIGLPEGEHEIPKMPRLSDSVIKSLVPRSVRLDYKLLSMTFRAAKHRHFAPTLNKNNLRKDPRIRPEKQTTLYLASSRKRINARLFNLSVNGFEGILDKCVESGTKVKLQIPVGKNKLTTVIAECAWSKGFRHGFTILNVTTTWERYINHRPEKSL